MSRLLPFLGFLLLAALLGFGIWWSKSHDSREVRSPLLDKPAPAFSLPRLDRPDQAVSRSDLLGKPYLLNVFGSWCPACAEEHPVLMAQGNTLGIALIGYNYKDEPADAAAWLDQRGNPYDLIIADREGRTAIDFGVYGAPETFLIDAHGTIRYKHLGPLTADVIARELQPAIAALRGPSP
jgi:cytochrome c biogenesis protein CcmG/thiol:disulfide interchange protein DsbE